MQYSALLLFIGLAGQALAQSQCSSVAALIPDCAKSCIESADLAVGCATTDFACGCSKSAQIQQSAAGCVIGACPISLIGPIQSSAAALCSCVATASAAPTTTLVTTTKTSTTTTTSTPAAASSTTSAAASTTSAAATTSPAAATTTPAAASTSTSSGGSCA